MIPNRIACLWLPNWPIQRFAIAAGHKPAVQPVLLYEARGNGGLKVVACSPAAAVAGTRAGMPLAEAIALVEGYQQSQLSHSLITQAHDPVVDRQELEELAIWCQQFSPIVCLEDTLRPECLLLDVTGTVSLFGGETALAERLQRAFADRGLQVRVALADTIGAAWALARYGRDRPLPSLPVAALRLSEEAVARLESLGIEQIGQLALLPRKTLSSRFGAEVLLRLDQAMGHLPETLVSQQARPEFAVEWPLEYPTDRQETIDFVLETLVVRLVDQLSARREGVLRLECRFDLQSGDPLRFSVGLFRATATAKHLLELIHLQLEKYRLRTLVQEIRLTAMAAGPLELEQQPLFAEDRDRTSPRHLAALVDRLASRLGRDAVLRPRLLADAQPEHACQYLPFHQVATGRRAGRVSNDRSFAIRPLQLFEPVALQATAVVPEGPPIRFCAAGCEQRVVHVWGPERIETGWWRKRGVRRDYYRVETHTGQRFWLFRRIGDARWFWQGTF